MVIDDESPADTKLIICQNSKPWSNFKKVKLLFQTAIQHIHTPKNPKQSKCEHSSTKTTEMWGRGKNASEKQGKDGYEQEPQVMG